MFSKILIANRGEIACRVIKTAHRMGIRCVAIYSDADRDALHVAMADEAYHIGPSPAAESYLRGDRILEIARMGGAEAIHPGYGFLAENAEFADACEVDGMTFIGPPANAIRAMGLKDAAKALMEKTGVPVVPGYHGESQEPDHLLGAAEQIGFPVLLKAVAGGGGKGMRRVDNENEFQAALDGAKREAAGAFGNDRMLVEKFLVKPRHIEVQVFADGDDNALYLFERDCSLQRRHQKVIEEAPAPGLSPDMRMTMGEAAVSAAKAIGYRGAGTVEFIADVRDGLHADRFYFMEMNTRLQVEHPVTEMITGLDLVEWQLRVAAGEPLPLAQDDLAITGHAIEARIYAEDAMRGFLPQTGSLEFFTPPVESDAVRVDTGVRAGDTIAPFYDPMIAKLIVHAATRGEALRRMGQSLSAFHIDGCTTNISFLKRLIEHSSFVAGEMDTGLIDRHLDDLTAPSATPSDVVAIAALYMVGALSRPHSPDPWDALMGWRVFGNTQQFAQLIDDGVTIEVPVTFNRDGSATASVAGDPVTARLIEKNGSSHLIAIGDRVTRANIHAGLDHITVFLVSGAYRFGRPDHVAGDEDGEDAALQVKAPLPGRIQVLHVQTGDTVAKGAPLAVLEAMKMEHTLTAPRDVVIGTIHFSEGDQVEEGAVLMVFEDGEA